MKILFVAFEFPPYALAGVHRSIRFTKYLSTFGITPIVITTDARSVNWPLDYSLLNGISEKLIIERIPCKEYRYWKSNKLVDWFQAVFRIVEPLGKWWKQNLKEQLPRVINTHHPDVIYVSLPPFAMGPLWREIAQSYQIPLVFDFRDGWSQWQITPYMTKFHYLKTLELERQCLNDATRVICSSEQIRKDLLEKHSHIPEDKLITITNGFDADITEWSIQLRLRDETDPFVIGYVGSFYYSPAARKAMLSPWWQKKPHRMLQYSSRKEDWLYRSPYFFFRTVAMLLHERPTLLSILRIKFVGQKPAWIDEQIAEFGLENIIEFLGPLSHSEALKFEAECDCLLLTSSKVIGGNDYSIAGKTFEYFSAKRPIVGFVSDGAQKDLLAQSGIAVICNPDQVEESAQKLSDLVDNKLSFSPNVPFLKSLHSRKRTEALANVFFSLK